MTMSCESVSGVLAEYLAGELAPDQRAAVELHLGTCAACRERAAGLGAAQAALRGMVPPREHAEALAAGLAFPAAAAGTRRPARGRWSAIAAGLALAFLAGYAARGSGGGAGDGEGGGGGAPAPRPARPRLVEAYQRAAAQHPGAPSLAWGLMSVARR